MGYAGRQLAERRHLLGLDQASLRRLQLAERRLGSVTRSSDLGLGALTFGDVAVDHDKSAARHRVVAHLKNSAVRAGAFIAVMPVGILGKAVQLGLGVGRGAELAAPRK